MDAPGTVPDSINCHSCGAILDLTGQIGFTHVECKHCGAPSVVPLKFGDFLLLNVIGTGGTGTVYKAIDVPLNRYLALKVLRSNLASDPEFVARFSGEARATATVNHPNVAQVYSFGEIDHWYYMAMELCDQGSLDDRITKLGRLPDLEVLTIGLQIASALRIAWQHGVLHRDVKPGNVLFNEDGVPKLVDYGLASGPGNDPQSGLAPDPERIWGTPYYVAPEKLRGKPEDERSDIYSLGATLFHALGGQPPLDSATATDAAGRRAMDPAASLRSNAPSAQKRTIHIIARMLAQNPAERYGSYDEVIQDLMEAQDSLRKTRAVTTVAATGRKRFAALYLLGTLLLCGGVVWFVWKHGTTVFQSVRPSAPATSVPAHTAP
ncbi:MAG: serine/threonine-protein kinase [Verrucomicrobiia bacterium]|jgi:serine/threonine protein kinase